MFKSVGRMTIFPLSLKQTGRETFDLHFFEGFPEIVEIDGNRQKSIFIERDAASLNLKSLNLQCRKID